MDRTHRWLRAKGGNGSFLAESIGSVGSRRTEKEISRKTLPIALISSKDEMKPLSHRLN
jgi:hypothetical protein